MEVPFAKWQVGHHRRGSAKWRDGHKNVGKLVQQTFLFPKVPVRIV